MKKITSILILVLLVISSVIGFSQTNTFPGYPLYGTSASTDGTYRALQLGTTTISDTSGTVCDTIQLIPGYVSGAGSVFHKDYILNLKDSCALAISQLGNSYQFSTMTIYVSAPSISSKVYFIGYSGLSTKWALAAGAISISPTASHWYIINFVQIGSVWAQYAAIQD